MDLHLPYPLQKSRKGRGVHQIRPRRDPDAVTTLASGSRGPEDYGDSARGAYRVTPHPEIYTLSSWALGGVHG